MRNIVRDEDGVVAKFGVRPQSIPDYLAVVGDKADGFPGIPGWGIKAASQTFTQYPHLEDIPKDWREWDTSIRKARLLSESLFNGWSNALLFRTLATLRQDAPVFDAVDDLQWRGATPNFAEHCNRLKSAALLDRVRAVRLK
jgi:5'-3' exonuclease